MATDLVADRLQQVIDAGLSPGNAAIFLGNSRTQQAAGRYREAFALLIRAYRELM